MFVGDPKMAYEKRRDLRLLQCGALTCLIAIATSFGAANAEPPARLLTVADATTSDEVDCTAESLDGCFTSSDQMDQYLAIVSPLLTEFFVTSYGANFPKPKIRYVARQERGRSGCVDEYGDPAEFDQRSYFYCGPDATMYLGQAMMWSLYEHAGPVAPALGLAHEWGHHLQKERRVRTKSHVALENQADCVAGAWLLHENGKGLFKSMVDDATISAISIMLGDTEGRSHGIDYERLMGFAKGSTQGLTGCDPLGDAATPLSPR
jgi:predicted metalloprotease